MDFNYGIDYKKLPEYIKVAEEVIRGLGGAAAQETAIEEAQEVVEERTDEQIPPVVLYSNGRIRYFYARRTSCC